ncbi:nucleotidyltransferase [Clostridium sp. UBA6640]|uniref:nucleotidyltransferase n=1 Tax=Clostridium sp. UBA6640 TaxID=1946370 RepID=UPI0025C49CB7|nr:nucleotidyltransferase [Clostridium sp. UBA6640]
MKVCGIIVEYNPLHNGHVYHINKTKELTGCDILIAVMSGNFNQRGIPSIVDKYNKTKMALDNGIDLVFELPTIYSASSAEFFSFGAISLLNSLSIVDSICFGSEHGDISILMEISKILESECEDFKIILKENLKKGTLYPKARSQALFSYLQKENYNIDNLEEILNSSNNILGIEYIKSLLKLNSNIKPYTIKREGASYNSMTLNNVFSSATSIREYIKSEASIEKLKAHVPTSVFNHLQKLQSEEYNFTFDESMLPYIKYKSFLDKNSLEKIPDVSEGLHNKIYSSLCEGNNYNDIIERIKSKRYTRTRISRILCQYFIGFDNFDSNFLRNEPCSYARILGFNEKGKSILKSIKSNSNIPLYTKLPKNLNETLKLELQASRAYSLLNKNYRYNEDYLTSPLKKS